MSKKQPPRVQLNFEPDYDPPPAKQNEVDIDIEDVDVQEIDMMPQVVEKEKINEKDIFDDMDTSEETGESNPNFIYEKIVVEKPEPVVKKAKSQAKQSVKEKKPRKPMSEEHKAKLALAREKAMIARKAKAEERKKMKALENEEKELLKQQKVKKVQKLKKEVEEPEPEPEVQKISASGITRKDLEDAQFDAIVKYETLRKQRKAEKKQQQALEQSKQELLNKLQPQQYGYGARVNGRLVNRWDSCY